MRYINKKLIFLGTSHSQSRLLELKDGASWAALEYAALVSDLESKSGDIKKQSDIPEMAVIIPVGLIYVQKSKYRSSVIAT
jgi:hypothetical protein